MPCRMEEHFELLKKIMKRFKAESAIGGEKI
jgi:hypothetical protein